MLRRPLSPLCPESASNLYVSRCKPDPWGYWNDLGPVFTIKDLNPELPGFWTCVSTHSNHGLILEKVWEVAMLKFRYCKNAIKFEKKMDFFFLFSLFHCPPKMPRFVSLLKGVDDPPAFTAFGVSLESTGKKNNASNLKWFILILPLGLWGLGNPWTGSRSTQRKLFLFKIRLKYGFLKKLF